MLWRQGRFWSVGQTSYGDCSVCEYSSSNACIGWTYSLGHGGVQGDTRRPNDW